MSKYLKQGFVRKLEWQLAREEIHYSKMVELMEEECIKNYKAEMKEIITDANDGGLFDGSMDDVDDRMYKDYYNETFNTKEK